MIDIKLKDQEYRAKLDFEALGNIQIELQKKGLKLGVKDIFDSIKDQNMAVVTEVLVQSILRCHPQLKRYHILDKLTLDNLQESFEALGDIVKGCMPSDEGKQIEEVTPLDLEKKE